MKFAKLEGVFTAEGCVILTSTIGIDSYQWQKYFCNKWNNLMKPNAKVLVLAGIHGHKDGKLGLVDDGLLGEYEHQIDFLKKKYKEDIEKKKITFILEDVGAHMDRKKLNEEALVAAVKKHNPTIISLAFCYTNMSVLNNVLRAAGIYSVVILNKDRADITEDRCIELDEIQRKIVEDVAENQPQNIFLWGSSGTGKTIMLAEAMKMKISQYMKKGVKLNIFVTSYMATPESQLMIVLKDKYLSHMPLGHKVQFIPFHQLCKSN